MDLDYVQIGERLKKVRGKISLAAFGDQFGYSYSYVRSCENGKKPSLEYLHEIVNFFGVSLNWLIYGIEPYSLHDVVGQQKNDKARQETLIDEAMVLVKKLDKLVNILQYSNQQLFSLYKTARVIVDAHRRKSTKENQEEE